MASFWTVTLALAEGLGATAKLFVLTLVFALPLGLVICFGSTSAFAPLRWLVKTVVWIIRGSPLMLQILIVYYGPGLLLGLPLLLARKHPFLIAGWLAVGLSCLALNPYTSVSPWGLIGGLRRLYYYITISGIRDRSTILAIAVGIVRGLLILALAFVTWRAWKKKKSLEKDG